MIKTLIIVLQIIALMKSGVAQIPKVSNGSISRLDSFSSKYIGARHIDVWLPEGYNTKNKYAVIYMHDGQMLYDSTTTWNKQEWMVDEHLSQLLKEDKIKRVIVVGIHNKTGYRHTEYFPQKPLENLTRQLKDTLYKNDLKNGALADNYLKFIVKELKPYIDRRFATLRDRANTFIAGSSMGGLISLYAICEYPKIFGGAACISTHWPGSLKDMNSEIPIAFNAYLLQHLPSPKQHKLYFDYGTATLDSLYEPHQMIVDETMKKKGFSKDNWLTLKYEGADHSERSWQKRLNVPFQFLLTGQQPGNKRR